MTKTKLAPAKDWRNREVKDWNVSTFHAYLIDIHKETHNVTYEPFGQGPVSERWRLEQGQLKNSIKQYGTEVIKVYIDKCFIGRSLNPKYPTLSYGFMFAYMRTELSQAEVEVNTRNKEEELIEESKVSDIDSSWF